MRTLIEDYRIVPGEHCGSSAMRGLLDYYCGVELPEAAVFGLGAGPECIYLSGSAMDASRVIFGRTANVELDAAASLQVDYRERLEPNDDEAWRVVRDEVLAGRPTMLSGDILYLDYREFKVHFPSHRFVLLGFDDAAEKAFIADRVRPEPEACSYGALRKSRNPPEGISTFNLWGRFHETQPGRPVVDAARWAIDRCARRMLGGEAADGQREASPGFGGETSFTNGVAAIRRVADELPSWADCDDAAWIAGFNARCIEKFGNGSGNFRRLYARFLDWADALAPGLVPQEAPGLARRAADGWTAVSESLARASEDAASPAPWRQAAQRAAEVADIEDELFRRLSD